MDNELSTQTLLGLARPWLEGMPKERLTQADQPGVVRDRHLALIEAQNMARAELARRRKRLGELTPEQEIALENLLFSAVTKVSELAERAIETLQAVTVKTSLQRSATNRSAAV
jgi:hypothetical protein